MTGEGVKNVTASVLARLRNESKSSGAPFQQVLQLYAMERFLYRISQSGHAQSVILKGALLLKKIGISKARPTMDIDMLRTGRAAQGESELMDAFGRIVDDLKIFAVPLLRSLARGERLAQQRKAGPGWVAEAN